MLKLLQKYKNLLGSTAGVVGINRRNLEFIYPNNPRSFFPSVDDKLKCKNILQNGGLPVPETYCVIISMGDIPMLDSVVAKGNPFVIKPAHGYGGQGILVIDSVSGNTFTSVGKDMTREDIEYHIAGILSGLFSLDHFHDKVFLEYKIEPVELYPNSPQGVFDIRIIVLKGIPIMGMLRVPTHASAGKANLHAGGLGIGINIINGSTADGVLNGMPVVKHPDSGEPLAGLRIPFWYDMIEVSRKINALFHMDYLGIDFVIDRKLGPLILEVNARPGLTIQIANRQGMEEVV